jgi:hypothetical protein
MAIGDLPPWLNVGPRDFGNAASEGARLNLARQQADMETAMNAVKIQVQKQQADREFAAMEQRHAFDTEMKRSEIGMKAQQAARKFAAQQQYQSLVNSGVEPAEAMLKVGPALGVDMVGLGQLAKYSKPPAPPNLISLGGNDFVQYAGNLHPIRKQAKWQQKEINGHLFQENPDTGELKPLLHSGTDDGVLTPQEKERIKFLQNQIKMISSDPLAGRNPTSQMQLQKYVNEINSLTGGEVEQEAPAPAAAPTAQSSGAIQMVWNPEKKRYMMPRQ